MMLNKINHTEYGLKMYNLMEKLFPLCRSITGNGVRETLSIIKELIPISIYEVPTDTNVYDWIIPKEWNVKEAWIKYKGEDNKIIDFSQSNLYLLNYSRPYKGIINFEELNAHLHTIEEYPDWIPYRTTYYTDTWGFCLPYNIYKKLDKNREFEVCIDLDLKDGFLTYGDYYIKGKTKKEILISTYLCHPSLCNDNLSGVVLSTYLAKVLTENKDKLNYSYRFVFCPETIGAVTWLSKNKGKTKRIIGGLVATCVGDNYPFTYKKTKYGNSLIDKIAEKALKDYGMPYRIMDYYPGGSDERQYCSPGINLPVGSLVRGLYITDDIPPRPFKQYHTSADNLNYVNAKYLGESFGAYLKILDYIEKNRLYKSLNPNCEPFLAKRNLSLKLGSGKNVYMGDVAIRFVMCYSDGNHDLIDIANLARVDFDLIYTTACKLKQNGLLK